LAFSVEFDESDDAERKRIMDVPNVDYARPDSDVHFPFSGGQGGGEKTSRSGRRNGGDSERRLHRNDGVFPVCAGVP
jgi:hypothetical protein